MQKCVGHKRLLQIARQVEFEAHSGVVDLICKALEAESNTVLCAFSSAGNDFSQQETLSTSTTCCALRYFNVPALLIVFCCSLRFLYKF